MAGRTSFLRGQITNNKMSKKVVQDPRRPYHCEFCGKNFVKEKYLVNHVCEQKRRWMNKDEKYVKLGFYAYRRFYQLTKASGKKDSTYEEFCKSKYYTAFNKFGRHVLSINAINPEGFIDFVIKSGVKLDDWTQDWVYEMWVRELCKRETPEQALERSLLMMQQWSMESGEEWWNFFRKISTVQAVNWIRNGKISPWALYCAPSSKDLFARMSDEQLGMIEEYIHPGFWKQKMTNNKEDVEYIKNVFREAGL